MYNIKAQRHQITAPLNALRAQRLWIVPVCFSSFGVKPVELQRVATFSLEGQLRIQLHKI